MTSGVGLDDVQLTAPEVRVPLQSVLDPWLNVTVPDCALLTDAVKVMVDPYVTESFLAEILATAFGTMLEATAATDVTWLLFVAVTDTV